MKRWNWLLVWGNLALFASIFGEWVVSQAIIAKYQGLPGTTPLLPSETETFRSIAIVGIMGIAALIVWFIPVFYKDIKPLLRHKTKGMIAKPE